MSKIILAIESSCDETSVAIIADGRKILANQIASQIDLHRVYGGVVPEIASRRHVQNIVPVYRAALNQAGIKEEAIDAVAVTYGPGLVGALLVGLSFAKSLAYALKVPLIGVNHLVSHMYANFVGDQLIQFPLLCLVVSGGHTELIYMDAHLHLQRLGHTRDDAAGEAFDKIARRMGLGYPGGPMIDQWAQEGDSKAFAFPRAELKDNPFDFSFSGLKSAVINVIHNLEQKNSALPIADIAASFQQAVVDVLVTKTVQAAQKQQVKQVCLAGGVAANRALRTQLTAALKEIGINLHYPAPILCTDNAAMVGAAAYYYWQKGYVANWSLNAKPNLKITENVF